MAFIITIYSLSKNYCRVFIFSNIELISRKNLLNLSIDFTKKNFRCKSMKFGLYSSPGDDKCGWMSSRMLFGVSCEEKEKWKPTPCKLSGHVKNCLFEIPVVKR